jgi:Rrf2 family protein
MLTAKGKYCLKALVCLASLAPGARLQAVEIAAMHTIPKKFLDAILGDLRRAGVVFSKKGPGGGYMLARAPDEIRIGQIIRMIDGPLAPLACASRTAFRPCRDCRDVKTCTIRVAMTRVRDAMSEILDHMSVADLVGAGASADGGGSAPSHGTRPRRRSAPARTRKKAPSIER